MAIQQPAQAAKEADPEITIRQRLNAVLTERDFWQGVAESKQGRIDQLTETTRYRLSIVCDHHKCKATLSVSASKPPAEGDLAIGLLVTAGAMRWGIGPETMAALNALIATPGRKYEPFTTTAKADHCPDHRDQ